MSAEQDHSKVFFFLPSTVDRSEEIISDRFHLRDFFVNINELGEDFNPAISFDRAAVVKYMKKAAEQSSWNSKRNVV